MWDQFGAEFDFPDFAGQPQTYLIASSGRTGSHYLANLMFQTGQFGSPFEYLNPVHLQTWQDRLSASDLKDQITKLYRLRTAPSGWFGVKAHWPQFETICHNPEFPDWFAFKRVVHLTRQDVLDQAISLVIARQTKAWISFHTQAQPSQYDPALIQGAVDELQSQNHSWQAWLQTFKGDVTSVEYTDFVQDPFGVLRMICTDFGVPFDPNKINLSRAPQRQSTQINADWKRRFLSESAV